MKHFLVIISVFLGSLSLSAQDFDPVNPDYDLLKQLVMDKINDKRAKKAKTLLKNNTSLQLTSDNYTRTLRAVKLESNSKNKLRFDKKIKKASKFNGYKNAFIDYHITSINCVNFKGSKFYYDREDTDTKTHLFIGTRPTKQEKADEKFKANPLKLYTYQELAQLIVKQFISDEGTFKILNNGFDKYGFSLAVEQSSLFRHKIPKIKVILIVGGNRITW